MPAPSSAPHSRASAWQWPDLVLIAITMFWGGTFLITQTGQHWSGPFGFVAVRFATAATLLAGLVGRRLRHVTRAELRAGVVIGIVLFFGYTLQASGLRHIASSKSAFLTALYMPLVPLLQFALFGQRPRPAAWLSVALAFAGLVLLSEPAALRIAFDVGEGLTLAAAVAMALEIILIGRFAPGADPKRLAVVQLSVVALLSTLTMAASGEQPPQFAPGFLACGLGLGAATAFIQAAMNWAQKTVSPTRAGVIYAMEAVWAGVVGSLAGERLGMLGMAGAALIIFSVLAGDLRLPRRWAKGSAAANRDGPGTPASLPAFAAERQREAGATGRPSPLGLPQARRT